MRPISTFMFLDRETEPCADLSAEVFKESGEVHIRNFASSIELSADETEDAKAKLVDHFWAY